MFTENFFYCSTTSLWLWGCKFNGYVPCVQIISLVSFVSILMDEDLTLILDTLQYLSSSVLEMFDLALCL